MPTTVEPSTFRLVDFDAGEIAALADDLARRVGLGDDVQIHVEVDETTPLGHTEVVSLDPVHIRTESGSFEDPKHLRRFSPEAATDVLGRYLMRAADRRLLGGDERRPARDGALPLHAHPRRGRPLGGGQRRSSR